jgi:hypothetical protein
MPDSIGRGFGGQGVEGKGILRERPGAQGPWPHTQNFFYKALFIDFSGRWDMLKRLKIEKRPYSKWIIKRP